MQKLIIVVMLALLSSCGNEQSAKDEKLAQVQKENEALRQEIVRLNNVRKDKPDQPDEPVKPPTNANKDDLSFLKNFNGKYPYEVKLLENAALTKRLKGLIKSRYDFLKETWAVETPIEVTATTFVASACQAHNCGYTNFIIVYDFSSDVLYAGIREEKVASTYSEDGSTNEAIRAWANDEN